METDVPGFASLAGARLQLAVEAAGLGFWEWHTDAGRVCLSEEARRITGLEADVPVEVLLAQLHPADANAMSAALPAAFHGDTLQRLEFRLLRPDQSVRWVRTTGRALTETPGNGRIVLGTIEDVTDARTAEAATRLDALRSASLIDNVTVHVWMARTDGATTFANQRALEYAGCGHPAGLGDACVTIVHPDDAARHREDWDRALRTGRAFRSECRLRGATGEYRWFTVSAVPFRDESGAITHWLGSNADYEAAREAHETRRMLIEKERLLQRIVEASPDVIHSFRVNDDGTATFPYASRAIEQLYGCRPEDLARSASPVMDRTHPDDVAELSQAITRSRRTMQPFAHRWRMDHPDRGVRWIEAHSVPVREGSSVTWHGVLRDITEQHRFEREAQMRSDALENALAAFIITGADHRIVYANRTFLRLWGYETMDEVVGTVPADHCADPGVPLRIEEAVQRDGSCTVEFAGRRRDGAVFETLMTVQRSTGPAGDECLISTAVDITDRRRAEDELRTSQARLLAALEVGDVGTWVWEAEHDRLIASQRDPASWGVTERDLDERGLQAGWELFVPEDRALATENWLSILRGERDTFANEFRLRRADGGLTWLALRGRAERDAEGRTLRIIGASVDITAAKEAEQALRSSEERFSRLFQLSPIGTALVRTTDRTYVDANGALARLFGTTRDDLIGRPTDAVPVAIDAGQRERFWREIAEYGRADDMDYSFTRPDGSRVHTLLSAEVLELEGERFVLAAFNDITGRRAAEEALRDASERLEQLAESIQEVFWLTDPDKTEILYISPAYEAIWGRSRGSLRRDPASWLDDVLELDRDRVRAALGTQTSGQYDVEYRIRRPDGDVRWIRDRAFPVFGADGQITRIAGVAEDITERRELELQLRQAQKMESVGQLAGGVAHDFNNWLTVIQSYSELIAQSLPAGSETREFVSEVEAATARAASLTRQLLAFSRLEVVESRPVDIDQIVVDTEKMLRRVIGEDISVVTRLGSSSRRVQGDAGQVVQVVMNLALNARDAMPAGGRIEIVTSVDRDDNAVLLRVTDSGVGMPPEVLARIFDPFFTTKGVGYGTGMGLAVVHGIVRRGGGRIDVESEPGRGTSFTVRFPSVAAAPSNSVAARPQAHAGLHGTETILLAEDEESIRRLAVRGLTKFGYRVLTASDGEEAWRIFRDHDGPIHAVVTDLIMPHMDGRELAERVLERQPAARIIYSSGYAGDVVSRHGALPAGVAFVQKPYTIDVLLSRIRETLDAS